MMLMIALLMMLGVPKSLTLSPETGSPSSTLHSVESSPSALFRMPARAPDQKDWTPDDSSTTCEECQTPFSLVRCRSILSITLLMCFYLIGPLIRFPCRRVFLIHQCRSVSAALRMMNPSHLISASVCVVIIVSYSEHLLYVYICMFVYVYVGGSVAEWLRRWTCN